MADSERIFINSKPIGINEVMSAEVFKGDTVEYGKSRIVVSEGP